MMLSYRRRASPLHAARAASGAAFCVALAAVALIAQNPLVLVAALVATVAAAALAGVGADLRATARFAVPLALCIALINPLVVRDGLTVIARLGELGPLGQVDVTLEATVYGAVLGLRALVMVLAFSLYSAAVDPDEVLALVRRISFRSALTAAIATRMLPVLARDAARMAAAQRCRPGPPPARTALLRAVATGALDRAVDVAATLEVRGYGGARRPARRRIRWSRHDLAFLAAAIALVVLAAGARLGGLTPFAAYPQLEMGAGAPELVLALALIACTLAPFADRRGIAR